MLSRDVKLGNVYMTQTRFSKQPPESVTAVDFTGNGNCKVVATKEDGTSVTLPCEHIEPPNSWQPVIFREGWPYQYHPKGGAFYRVVIQNIKEDGNLVMTSESGATHSGDAAHVHWRYFSKKMCLKSEWRARTAKRTKEKARMNARKRQKESLRRNGTMAKFGTIPKSS